MRTWKIYKHTLLIGPYKGWSYIGQTSQSNINRWRNGKGYKAQKVFYNAIIEFGWNNFSHEIIEENISNQETADIREQYYIKKYHTYIGDKKCRGYNSSKGGHGYHNIPKLQKPVICIELNKQWNTATDAANELNVDNSAIRLCCLKKRKTAYGYHWAFVNDTSTVKQLQAIFLNADRLPPQAKKVKCIETGIVYNCLNDAAKDTALKDGNSIGSCCLGKRKTAGGYHWEYL